MNVRQRVEAALAGQSPDQVPFTIYWQMVPKGAAGRRLREKGLGFWWRENVIDWEYPNCDIRTVRYSQGRQTYERTIWSTPVGEVSQLERLGGLHGASWQMEWPIKKREDYRVTEFVATDARPVACFEQFEKLDHNLGGDGFPVANYMYTPLQSMIVRLVGFETAAYHMLDYPDEFWSLHDALKRRYLAGGELLAEGPQRITILGGNCHPRILGRERFEKYVVPCYDAVADMLHERGKLAAAHMDADNAAWKDIIGQSRLDMVEAFTPPPDCDLSVADARAAWPEKIIGINFPSSLHLAPPERIREEVRKILVESGDGRGIIMGITEDVPEDRWEISLNAMADALNDLGRLPLSP